MVRDIVVIDEAKCDGCGLCAKACMEGAIRIIDGKARLQADFLCDGMGACLGHCPRGAIRIEKREAAAFDEAAVETHIGRKVGHAAAGCPSSRSPHPVAGGAGAGGGCPGSRFAHFYRLANTSESPVNDSPAGESRSELTHWPIQLRLLSPNAPVLQGAHLLVAADCVPIAYADFHRKLLRGRSVVIACPKLDDTSTYVEKLTEMLGQQRPASVTVAHMEVPCCTGLLMIVLEARRRSGAEVPIIDVVVGIRGDILSEKEVPLGAAA